MIETDGSRRVRAWLYDHGVERIACAATLDDDERPAGGILEPTVRALHAVATDAD